ncbi:UNVERIFIED_CONTAM: Gibberellin 3-beta-dioxygenase 1 [Sesamum calycinum]|uniref:gibberellin 3beta-dioxygenase n=1 Tax=Sesamum calycinum TaxID=2727403 RepID=A0AAW2LXS9_9LAMI
MATSLSQVYRDTHHHPKHIIPLDFDTVHELPDSHAWIQTDDFSCAYQICMNELPTIIPVIDLQAPNVVELMGNACQRWGMFQVTNHDISSSLVDDVVEHARRLFALPAERKLKALRSPSGATGYGVARISPFFSKLMWHEGFTIMGLPMSMLNSFGHHYEDFCDVMDNYQKKMKSLAYKILLLLLKSLGVDEEDQQLLCSSSASLYLSESALQLNSYPTCPNPNRAVGLAPHTDSLLLTILHQNDINGLQIFQEGIGWTPVPPVPGALIVNIGDLMHIISNARFPTVCHRVVPNETRHRFSIACFYGPPADSVVAPLSKLQIPRFRPVTVKEYISLKSKHLEEALHLLRI